MNIIAKAKGDRVRIEVIDSGPGVPDSFRSSIFKPFSQADSSDSRAREGTGLGLHICKVIIDRGGGDIGYLPRIGGGSVFWFEVDRVTDSQQILQGT